MRDPPQNALSPLLANLSLSTDPVSLVPPSHSIPHPPPIPSLSPTLNPADSHMSSRFLPHPTIDASAVEPPPYPNQVVNPVQLMYPPNAQGPSQFSPLPPNPEDDGPVLTFVPAGARAWATPDANVLTSPQQLSHRVAHFGYRPPIRDPWAAAGVWRNAPADPVNGRRRRRGARDADMTADHPPVPAPDVNFRPDRKVKAAGRGSGSVREYNRRISACARRRDLNGALRTLGELDRAPKVSRNLFTYNAVINALVMCSQYAKADEFWREMQEAGIEPNLVTFNTMLKSCFGGMDEDVERAFRLLKEMEERGISADRVTLNSLINACVSAGKVQDAHGVYEQMRRLNIEPDAYTFCTLAKQARHQCDVSMLDALLLHQLHHHTLLRQRIERSVAGGTKEDTADSSMQISPVAYNTIADAYIRCGYPARAISLLERMRKHHKRRDDLPSSVADDPANIIPVSPDVQTFNVRLKALRESGASSNDAFATLEEMGAVGLEADHITLLTLADLCCRRGEMSHAEGVLRAATQADVAEYEKGTSEWKNLCNVNMNANGRSGPHGNMNGHVVGKRGPTNPMPSHNNGSRRNANQPKNAKANAALFNALIRGYSSLDPPNVEAAVALYVDMRRYVQKYGFSWYAADSVTYTMLVDGFARVSDASGAEIIIQEMEAAGRANVVAYNAFLKANRGNGFQAALSILERMKSVGLRPDVVTYNTIIDFLSAEENGTQLAEDLVRIDMPRNGVRPDLLTFNTLIKGVARNRGNKSDAGAALISAYRWLNELESRGLKPDEFTYQSMVSACAAAGDAPRALEFFRKVEEERAKRVNTGGRVSFSSNLNPNATQPPSFLRNHLAPIPTSRTAPAVGSRYNPGNMSSPHISDNRNFTQSGEPGSADWMLLPHPAAYIALMRAFLTSNAKDGVDSVLLLRDEMMARGLELGRTGYTAVADAYAARGDFDRVEATLREMLSREGSSSVSKLSPVHHCIRMKALCNAGRLDDAIAILPEVEDADTAVFNVLIHACAKTKDMDRMIVVLKAMESCNVEPDAITSRALSNMMRTVATRLKGFSEHFRTSLTMYLSNSGNLSEQADVPSTWSGTPLDSNHVWGVAQDSASAFDPSTRGSPKNGQ